jgi:plasmid stability protein
MTTLTVRGLPDRIVEQLKARARTRRRSLEAELREVLIQAASQPLILDALAEADRIAALTPSRAEQLRRRLATGNVTGSAA